MSRGIINSHCYIAISKQWCMNKAYILKMMQKRTTKLAVFFVLAGVMMVFLVPMLIEEAQAATASRATTNTGSFSNISWHLFEGRWTLIPSLDRGGIAWSTIGPNTPFGGGNERGVVEANVGQSGKVQFHFSNPGRGANTCSAIVVSGPISATCHITQGDFATATYSVISISQENNNKHCDILDKYSGQYAKLIREKLHC
jgi:hypothetical protein